MSPAQGRASKTTAAPSRRSRKPPSTAAPSRRARKPPSTAAPSRRARKPPSAAAPSRAGGSLVIVESPAKARTIAPLLGRGYTVKASLGHVRDLPKSRLGVDVDRDFEPRYLVPREKSAVVQELKSAVKNANAVYLATDPDREGEAISWHLLEAGQMGQLPVKRVVFHEITPEAIKAAFQHPREIDMDLVDAQQARRVVDRLVGYSLSPILWAKIRGGLSAGRVQSVALRMVVDREREIEQFVSQEYWSLEVDLAKQLANGARGSRGKAALFRATLVNLLVKRGRISIPDQTAVEALVADLRPAAFRVSSVAKKQNLRQPEPPFTTSTLQQEASRKLGFTAQRTMAVAQQLYEGLNVGSASPVGLITYMRTDSVRVAESAVHQARGYIQGKFGGDFVPKTPRHFTRRARGAQEAHEAVRPTSIPREPEQLRSRLSNEQYRLYDLIWKRMVASQMAPATVATLTVNVEGRNNSSGNAYELRASSSVVVFPGYQVLYRESRDDADAEEMGAQAALSDVAEGQALELRELYPRQHFTQPPPRYTDATLIKALEANGIGRPSTYAPILTTLQGRGYVHKEKRLYMPDELGLLVSDLITEHFPDVVDINFTARLEDELDQISEGKRQWVPVVKAFYGPFSDTVERAKEVIPKVEFTPEPTGEDCELCGSPMVFRLGRYGKFQACSAFPKCRNTKPVLKTIGVNCPKDSGALVEKRGRRRGRIFYGCANYPACDFTSWDRPIEEPCPQCGGLVVQPRRGGSKCSQCGYTAGQRAGKAQATKPTPEAQPAGAGRQAVPLAGSRA